MTATQAGVTQGTTPQGLGATSRRDPWWIEPSIIAAGFGAFVVYSLFSALLWERDRRHRRPVGVRSRVRS